MPESIAGRPLLIENTLFSHYSQMQKVARRIQRVWRKRCLRMRISALANIADYVAKINDKVIYVEQTVYLNL